MKVIHRIGRSLLLSLVAVALLVPVVDARPGRDDDPPPSSGACEPGEFSKNGKDEPTDPCQALADPAVFPPPGTTGADFGCWTLYVPNGKEAVDFLAVGAAGDSFTASGGRGDGMSGMAFGLLDGDRLRVCVNSNGGTAEHGGGGGGASGVSLGGNFGHPFVIAGGGGGAASRVPGGRAGRPDADPGLAYGAIGASGGSGGSGGSVAFAPGGVGVNGGGDGAEGASFTNGGPAAGGSGGVGGDAVSGGGGGGAGYRGGGGGGGDGSSAMLGGSGGGGASFCADTHVSGDLIVTGCTRMDGAGTETTWGAGAGFAKVTLSFHEADQCAPGTYSSTGYTYPDACQPLPEAFVTDGCSTLTVPEDVNSVTVLAVGAAGEWDGGLGDAMSASANGLTSGDQLRVCVNYGGGHSDENSGGGASGVAFGTVFDAPLVVAGGGGGHGANAGGAGGDAGMPNGQDGEASSSGSDPGGGGKNGPPGSGGTGGGYGGDGYRFDDDGPGRGGTGAPSGASSGGGGGAGYYGGGGGDDAPPFQGSGGGGGGTSFCGDNHVSPTLTISGCARTAGAGTESQAGSGEGFARVVLAFSQVQSDLPPTMNGVTAELHEGGQIGSAAIRLTWTASDDVTATDDLEYRVQVRRLKNGNWRPWGGEQLVTDASFTTHRPFWRKFQYRVQARDEAGNWSDWSESNTILPIRRQERHFSRSAGWTVVADPTAMRGKVARSSTAGASAQLKFNGTGVALVMPAAAGQGSVQACLDPASTAVLCQTIDLGTFTPDGTRRFVAVFSDLAAGKHVLQVTVVSGSVDLDGAVFSR